MANGQRTGRQERQTGVLHAAIGERRREDQHVVYTEPIRRQNRLCRHDEPGGDRVSADARAREATQLPHLLMASPNSQYAASIVSGSAHTPADHCFPSTLGHGR